MMPTPIPFALTRSEPSHDGYARASLPVLAQRIVDDADRDALAEFHERRTVFRRNGSAPMLFVQYVAALKAAAAAHGDGTIADAAYDMVVDRFTSLPRNGYSGPDCRNYFRSYLVAWEREQEREGIVSGIRAGIRAAGLLQGLVTRHFRLSLLEAIRHRQGSRTRYTWVLPHGRITLLMPKHIAGQDRRRWLAKNVPEPDPARAGERRRVQAIVDEQLGTSHVCEYDDAKLYGEAFVPFAGTIRVPRITPDGLALAVANEKAEHITAQRPRIRDLGRARLRTMILNIFGDIAAGQYSDGAVARRYGLAKATFSRFAGSRWTRPHAGDGSKGIPDLWANTAQVVAADADFVAAAKDSGVWRAVSVLAGQQAAETGEVNHA